MLHNKYKVKIKVDGMDTLERLLKRQDELIRELETVGQEISGTLVQINAEIVKENAASESGGER